MTQLLESGNPNLTNERNLKYIFYILKSWIIFFDHFSTVKMDIHVTKSRFNFGMHLSLKRYYTVTQLYYFVSAFLWGHIFIVTSMDILSYVQV